MDSFLHVLPLSCSGVEPLHNYLLPVIQHHYSTTKEIKKQVNEMFPGEKITKIEKDSRKYEVELTNDVELKFDRKFNIREID